MRARARALLRDGVSGLGFASGLTRPARRAAGRLTIVTFHRVLPEAQRAAHPFPGLVVTGEELAWLLGFFGSHFRCGPHAEMWARWRAGEGRGRPLLAVTFDDGQADNFVHARPVLARAGVRATFFVPAGAVEGKEILWHERLGSAVLAAWGAASGRDRLRSLLGELPLTARAAARTAVERAKRMSPAELPVWLARLEEAGRGAPSPRIESALMTWEQLRILAEEGHEIGSHSLHHPILPHCDDARLGEEVAGSRRLLEERLGTRVESFCYPNGDHDARTVRAVRTAGYTSAVTTRPGLNPPGADRFRLRRHDMLADHLRSRSGSLWGPRVAWRLAAVGGEAT